MNVHQPQLLMVTFRISLYGLLQYENLFYKTLKNNEFFLQKQNIVTKNVISSFFILIMYLWSLSITICFLLLLHPRHNNKVHVNNKIVVMNNPDYKNRQFQYNWCTVILVLIIIDLLCIPAQYFTNISKKSIKYIFYFPTDL